MADDPSLTVRITPSELNITNKLSQPKRVILDTNLKISLNAKVLQNGDEVIIYTCANDTDKLTTLKNNNVDVIQANKNNSYVDLNFVMNDLAQRGYNEVLVEAGSTLVGSLLEHKLVDEMVVYMAPHLMGSSSKGIANLNYIQKMQDRMQFDFSLIRKIGDDLRLHLIPKYS
jgi:diaminohydroxyphosphoribosylaminopyrimidine deaminase/5-amino-6-(5-phosphoribosylamino)uracil reductase